MNNTCCYVIALLLLIVLILAITLPLILINKDDGRDKNRDWDYDSGIDINMYDKNKLPNTSLSDIVRQNDTKINSTSNSNDTA